MGFFEKISRSPSEKKMAAYFKEQDRKAKAQLQPNQQILPEVKSLALTLFGMSRETDQDWGRTFSAFAKYKEVAKKANSPQDLKDAALGHCVSYGKYLFSLEDNHPYLSTYSNLTSHWWQIFEDLSDIYLVSKYINLDPADISDILETLSAIDDLIILKFAGTKEMEEWREKRVTTRQKYPALRNL